MALPFGPVVCGAYHTTERMQFHQPTVDRNTRVLPAVSGPQPNYVATSHTRHRQDDPIARLVNPAFSH
jgi:hypothetical protein